MSTEFHIPNAFDPLLAVRAYRERQRLAKATLATVCALTILATLLLKPKFESEASLFVRLGRESAGLDPTATTSEITPIYETREQELNSTLEVMHSRKLLEAVIGVIGEEAILYPSTFDFDTWQQSLAAAQWPELNPNALHRSNPAREKVIEKIHRAVTLNVESTSSVIGITSRANTPDLAQAITRTLLEAFRTEHVRLNQTDGLKFFAEQVTMLQQQLEAIRQQITSRKNALGIISVTRERIRLEDVLATLEKQINVIEPGLYGARASAQVLAAEAAALPDRTQPNDATDTLKKKLHELQQSRSALLAKFTPRHKLVRDLDSQITLVYMQLADPGNRNAANPTLRELEVALAKDRTRIAQAQAQITDLRRKQIELRRQLLALNATEAEMLTLEDREVALKASLVQATEKREQARLLDELSRQRISNVQIVQPPTFNPKSVRPPRWLVLIAGVLLGLIAAFVVPAVVEFGAWYLQSVRADEPKVTSDVSTGELQACG